MGNKCGQICQGLEKNQQEKMNENEEQQSQITYLNQPSDHNDEMDIEPKINYCVRKQRMEKPGLDTIFINKQGEQNSHYLSKKHSEQKFPDISKSFMQDKNITNAQIQIEFEKQFQKMSTTFSDYIPIKKDNIDNYYKVKKLLLKNETSHIFSAVQINTGLTRLLKEINIETCKKIKLKDLKFEGICGILCQSDHPNIMRLFQIFYFQKKVILVLEYIQISLTNWAIKNEKKQKYGKIKSSFEQQKSIKIILAQILKALTYLHSKNIGHFGISLDNIMLNVQKNKDEKQIIAKLVGFSQSRSSLTYNELIPFHFTSQKRQQLAKDIFIAPQIKIQSSISLKTDVWYLGITFFKLLTGMKIDHNKYFGQSQQNLIQYMRLGWQQLKQNKPYLTEQCENLIFSMVKQNVFQRITAKQCLDHPWLKQVLQQNNCLPQKANELLQQKKSNNNFTQFIKSNVIYKNISQEETQQIAKIFYQLDKDHSGSLQASELLQYFQRSEKLKDSHVLIQLCQQIVQKIDKDSSGSIDFHQFVEVFCQKSKYFNKKNLKNLFEDIDWDGNGSIEISELKKFISKCQFKEILYYMKKIDSDCSGCISQSEFLAYCEYKFGVLEDQPLQKPKKQVKKLKKNLLTLNKNIHNKTQVIGHQDNLRPKYNKIYTTKS